MFVCVGDSRYYNSVKLEPDDAFSRLPPFWQHGLIFAGHSDFITVGQHTIICSIPFVDKIPGSEYNFNLTFQINGKTVFTERYKQKSKIYTLTD